MDDSHNIDESVQVTADDTSPTDVNTLCAEYLAGWKRAQADYANLKKEVEQERRDFAKYANERLLSHLLPAIDQYEIALHFAPLFDDAPEEIKKKFDNWFAGIKAVRGMWESAFKDIGLEKVPTDQLFDPVMHEAVAEEEQEGKATGEIIRVTQAGWRLHGKILRHAKVVISK